MTSRYALQGRIVTMDPHDTVIEDGVLYVGDGVIEDVRPAADPPPPGHELTPVPPAAGASTPG
ncbi:hypothetical protein ACFQ0T_39450 [Kitasatospora gansuensis]